MATTRGNWAASMMVIWVRTHRPDVVQLIQKEADKKFGARKSGRTTSAPPWIKAAK